MITKSAITESAITTCDSDPGGHLGLDHELAAARPLTLDTEVTLAAGVTLNPTLELLGASLEHLTGCYRKLTPAGKAAARRHREAEAEAAL